MLLDEKLITTKEAIQTKAEYEKLRKTMEQRQLKADIISGFTLYAPATFFVKGAEAFLAYFIWFLWKNIIKNTKLDIIPRAISAVVSGLCMAGGYFLYEWILYGFGGATASLVGNLTQAACCVACALCLISALYPVKGVRKLFHSLTKID